MLKRNYVEGNTSHVSHRNGYLFENVLFDFVGMISNHDACVFGKVICNLISRDIVEALT